jgi:hypothetical protein
MQRSAVACTLPFPRLRPSIAPLFIGFGTTFLNPPVAPALMMSCPQGQNLEWLVLQETDQSHLFGVRDAQPLCCWCPEQCRCPREFCFSPQEHEIILGIIPLKSRVGKRLLGGVRSWIEAAQLYEKNQLGLNQLFLNSLGFCWTMSLLADTVCLSERVLLLAVQRLDRALLACSRGNCHWI